MVSNQRKTLLVLSQVFVPDPASVGQHMADAAIEMVRRGHRVIVYSANRGYENPSLRYLPRENIGGVEVRRLALSSFGKKRILTRLNEELCADNVPCMFVTFLCAIFEPAFDWKAWRMPQYRLISLYSDADRQKVKEIEVEAMKILAVRDGQTDVKGVLDKIHQQLVGPDPAQPAEQAK